MKLLREIIESFTAKRPNLFERRGVPIGNLTSQIFANIYMNEFDQFVKHKLKIKYCIRIFIFVCNFNYLFAFLMSSPINIVEPKSQ